MAKAERSFKLSALITGLIVIVIVATYGIFLSEQPAVSFLELSLFEKREENRAYFSIPNPGYEIHCNMSAYNGTYSEVIRFSKRGGEWFAKWQTTKNEDSSKSVAGQLPMEKI